MSLLRRAAARLRGRPADGLRVRVVLKGRMGEGWFDEDRRLWLPAGATLAGLIREADRRGLRLSEALDASPHLRHTLMWNGRRTPIDEHADEPLADGDEIYLLGPVAGG